MNQFCSTIEESAFSSLKLLPALLNNLVSLGFLHMTPIQSKSLPFILEGQDVIAQAKTGSGKTAAFGLGLLNCLNVKSYAIQGLVLCPTRELAEQVSQALRQLARLMPNVKILNLSGGAPIKPQLDSLNYGAHIIVGTPGRVQKHLDKKSLSLHKLQILILDEADRMLDMGFFDAIRKVISACPKPRQTLLFSATYPSEIETLARNFLLNPKRIIIEEVEDSANIEQRFYEVASQNDKYNLLKNVLRHFQPQSTLIFCNTKEQTTRLTRFLNDAGFSAMALNGDMEQRERDLTIVRFKNNSCCIMVATDVAARGLDVKELPVVINFELAFEHEVHIHRIGRTGRAGLKGLAISLTTPADHERLNVITAHLSCPLPRHDASDMVYSNQPVLSPEWVTISLNVGRKNKIRPGDILGSLTKEAGLAGDKIGKIEIRPLNSYVAIHQAHVEIALKHFDTHKLKGRAVKVKKI